MRWNTPEEEVNKRVKERNRSSEQYEGMIKYNQKFRNVYEQQMKWVYGRYMGIYFEEKDREKFVKQICDGYAII